MRDDVPRRLLRTGATAVVAANDRVALGLLRALRESSLPEYQWPSIVGFDDDPELAAHLVTSLRLPWDELGRAAADLLWERSRGQLEGAATHRRVPMRLIPRLTCRKDWSATGHAALAVPA
jgi:DNA-binding LacI/PurR family transcriptional regulator